MTTNTAVVSDRIGAQVRALRRVRDWTRDDLAGRCASVGAAHITPDVIDNIESGRRDADGRRRRQVSADELVALALALNVAPAHLVIPIDEDECALTATVTVPTAEARPWFRGHHPLKGTDPRAYRAYVPENEARRAEQLAQLAEIGELIETHPGLFRITGPTESEDE